MKYNFEILFKREGYLYPNIHTLRFESENFEVVHQLVELYGQQDTVCFLKEFLSRFPKNSEADTLIEKFSQLGDEQLREKLQELLSENSDLKSSKQNLENKVSELSESKVNKEVTQLRIQITQLQRELNDAKYRNSQLSRDFLDEKNRSSQYRQNDTEYRRLSEQYHALFRDYNALQNQVAGIPQITQENEKLKKSKQDLEKRVQEIEQELQETQQKLSLATTRLRGINVNPNLAGGGSRSDQLKNEFSQLKMGLFHEASSKVLNGWIGQGSQLTFRSEEFSKIKSILSERVFGGGMAYFAKDKGEINAELHLITDVLLGIEDFISLSSPSFQKIQEGIQAGLLRLKGVDNSDQALIKYVEEVTKLIDQDLQQIANFKTTGEALDQIRKFAESGLRLVRDIVNDPNSGELFMPENGAAFDERSHDPRDEHKGQIKMTIYPGYCVVGNVLVKADVITHEPESILKKNELITSDSSEHNGRNSIDQQASSQALPQENDKSQDLAESTKSPGGGSINFKGKVTCSPPLAFRSRPNRDSQTSSKAGHNEELNFEGWIVGEPWDENHKESGSKWYKIAGQDWWLPACYINGEPPSDLLPMNSGGGDNEAQ
jgi:uncharacterized protein YceH (UPF0502 family)